jgi:hypothetical protein
MFRPFIVVFLSGGNTHTLFGGKPEPSDCLASRGCVPLPFLRVSHLGLFCLVFDFVLVVELSSLSNHSSFENYDEKDKLPLELLLYCVRPEFRCCLARSSGSSFSQTVQLLSVMMKVINISSNY